MTSVNIDPIINALLQLAATVLLAAGTWAVSRLVTWLGLKNSAQATATLDDALQKAVTYGLQQSQGLITHPSVSRNTFRLYASDIVLTWAHEERRTHP